MALSASCRLGINGQQIAFFRQGKGEAILFVHGITTYSFIWQKIVPFFENYEVLAVDLPGCGASEKNLNESFSIENHAKTLNQLTDELGINKFHFVGHDVGGGIGQIFAVNYPDKLLSLTLINSVAYDFWPVQPIIAMRTPFIRQLAMATLDMGTLKLIIQRGLYHKERLTPELVAQFWAPMKTKQGRKAFLHFASSLNNKHLVKITDKLRKLDLPTLIIRGDADAFLSGDIATKLAEEIPNARLLHIPTGNHFIQVDEPEIVAQALITFFTDIKNAG